MRAEQKTSPKARANYLEQAGDLSVTNMYLKVLSLVLGIAVIAAVGALFFAVRHYSELKPIVVRIDAVGKAEAIRYDDALHKPQEAEMRYFLSQWAMDYYTRNHFTITTDYPRAYYFFEPTLGSNVKIEHDKTKDVAEFMGNTLAPNTAIRIDQITLDHLSAPPYVGTIQFTAQQTQPYSNAVISEQKFTTTVNFMFRDTVNNKEIPINPLGMTILYFHDQQAFN